jgi:hypothetical protein
MPLGQAILGLMYGDPADQISRTLNPVNPNPNPNPGAPPAPGAAPGGPQPPGGSGGPSGAPSSGPPPPQPPMAASNATQSPPDLASLYVQLHRQDQAAAGIDRGLQGMAASFGTAQQQHDMMEAMKGINPDDRGKMLGNIIDDQAAQKKAQDLNRFQAGAAGMAQLLGVSPDQAQWLSNDPTMMKEVLKTHFDSMAPTDAMKNVDAAVAAQAQANPGMSQQDLAKFKSGLLSGISTGGDATTKEMMQANRTWEADPSNQGKPKPGYLTDPAQYKAYAAQYIEDQKDIGNAKNSFGANISKLTPVQQNIEWLRAHPAAVTAAIQHPNLTGGNLGYYTGALTEGQDALTARQKLDQLNSQLYSTSFTGGGAANQRLAAVEAQRLGAAFDPFKGENSANMSSDDIKNGLDNLKANLDSAVANTKAAAGHTVTEAEANTPYFNKAYLDPYSTLHSGATIAKSDAPGAKAGGGKTYTYNPKTGQLE